MFFDLRATNIYVTLEFTAFLRTEFIILEVVSIVHFFLFERNENTACH